MNILAIGDDLNTKVAAAMFASVGNTIQLFKPASMNNSFSSEVGLQALYTKQVLAGRIVERGPGDDKLDFVLMSSVHKKELLLDNLECFTGAALAGTVIVILEASYVGEAEVLKEELLAKVTIAGVCSVPLLVREGRAIEDFSRPQSIVVGCDDDVLLPEVIALFYPFNRMKNVIQQVSTREAEFASFARNAMLATRLSFMNEMASLAERSDVDIDVVRECIGSDPRIGREYLYPGCGYGGKSLSSHVDKVSEQLRLRNEDLGLLKTVSKINERQKDLLFRKIWSYFKTDLRGKKIAIWGASFKPGTNSIDSSPAINLIESLIAQSASVSVYDPRVNELLKSHFGDVAGIEYFETAYAATDEADVLAICTEWKEFWSPDYELLTEKLNNKAIFDGRNILDPNSAQKAGLRYFGIGRGERI